MTPLLEQTKGTRMAQLRQTESDIARVSRMLEQLVALREQLRGQVDLLDELLQLTAPPPAPPAPPEPDPKLAAAQAALEQAKADGTYPPPPPTLAAAAQADLDAQFGDRRLGIEACAPEKTA